MSVYWITSAAGNAKTVEALTRQFDGTQLEIIEGDVRDASRVTEAVRGVEVIFHEAAFVSVPQSMEEPQECFDVNITGTSLLFDTARARQASDARWWLRARQFMGSLMRCLWSRKHRFSRCRLMPYPSVWMKCTQNCSLTRLALKLSR